MTLNPLRMIAINTRGKATEVTAINEVSLLRSSRQTARIAVPATIAGLGAGLIGSSLLVYHYRHFWHESRPLSAQAKLPVRSGPPQLSLGTDLGGGLTVGLSIADGRF